MTDQDEERLTSALRVCVMASLADRDGDQIDALNNALDICLELLEVDRYTPTDDEIDRWST